MPLTKVQLLEIHTSIDKAEKALMDAIADIATARRAGINVTDMEKEVQDLRAQIRKLKAVYY
ncbi:unnamed protein product [marine sediment metagenome]|uniref:Uncharacterized protein n=2 Tax=marine sediment metagenome TaxID=412755 RepID=X1IAW1_9ZZZZ